MTEWNVTPKGLDDFFVMNWVLICLKKDKTPKKFKNGENKTPSLTKAKKS